MTKRCERLGHLVWERADRRGGERLSGYNLSGQNAMVRCAVYNPVRDLVTGRLARPILGSLIWDSLIWDRAKAEVEAAR